MASGIEGLKREDAFQALVLGGIVCVINILLADAKDRRGTVNEGYLGQGMEIVGEYVETVEVFIDSLNK